MNRINLYLEQLNEGNKVAGSRAPGDLDGAKNATIKPLDVEGVEDPEEPDHLQGVTEKTNKEEGVKYNSMSKDNVFERLYKQAINEDFDDMGGSGMGGSSMGGDLGGGGDEFGGSDFGDDEFGGEESGDIDADPSHVGKVREVVELLQQALDLLSSFEGEEEEEYEEYEGGDEDGEDFGGGDDFGGGEDEEPVTEEETHTQFGQAKTIGHALVSREKFNKGQDKKGNMKVKGANPSLGSKHATVPPGQKADGKLSKFSDAGGKKMQSKGNMKVPGRASNTGKFAFED